MNRFSAEETARLLESGWSLAEVPPGLTLAGLRAAGAPFKGTKFFDQHAPRVRETAFLGGEIAYRPGLMPGSLNQPFAACEALLARLSSLLPGSEATIAPAAVYVWLLADHHERTGMWLLQGCFAWAADAYGKTNGNDDPRSAQNDTAATHLVVGVFGTQRPLIVSPLPEGRGAGVGLMPIILPAAAS